MNLSVVLAGLLLVGCVAVLNGQTVTRDRHPGDVAAGDSEGPPCPRRCPSRRSRVCASLDGQQPRNFRSLCHAERTACRTGQSLDLVARTPCRRPAARLGSGPAGGDTSESSSEEVESNEEQSTTLAPTTTTAAATTTTTSETPTTSSSPGTSPGTSAFRPSTSVTTTTTTTTTGAAATMPAETVEPGPSVSGPPPVTERQCNDPNNCLPSSVVCGTDGVTYDSQCILEVVACVTRQDTLTVAHAGFCAV